MRIYFLAYLFLQCATMLSQESYEMKIFRNNGEIIHIPVNGTDSVKFIKSNIGDSIYKTINVGGEHCNYLFEDEKKDNSVHVEYEDGDDGRIYVYIKGYSDKSMLLWAFERNLANHLWQPMFIRENPLNSYNYVDPEGHTIISQGGTDWISPYIVKAVSDCNGDEIDKLYFTGGAHGYLGKGIGDDPNIAPTAFCMECKVFLDEKEIMGGVKWMEIVPKLNGLTIYRDVIPQKKMDQEDVLLRKL